MALSLSAPEFKLGHALLRKTGLQKDTRRPPKKLEEWLVFLANGHKSQWHLHPNHQTKTKSVFSLNLLFFLFSPSFYPQSFDFLITSAKKYFFFKFTFLPVQSLALPAELWLPDNQRKKCFFFKFTFLPVQSNVLSVKLWLLDNQHKKCFFFKFTFLPVQSNVLSVKLWLPDNE